MNLLELRTTCQLRTGYNADDFVTRWNDFINTAIRDIARKHPWDGLEDTIDLSTDGTQYVILPAFVDSVVSVLNITNRLPVDRAGEFDRYFPSTQAAGTTGVVHFYDKLGVVPAVRNPSGYVWFQSSHASDLGSLYITGRAANSGASGTGLQESIRTLSLTATGTSPQTLSTLFTRILSISKATDTNGDFFFYDAGSANAHVSSLGAAENQSSFRRLQLMFAPSAQTTLRVRFRTTVPPLRNDSQSPPPAIRDDVVVSRALQLFWEHAEQFSKADIMGRETNRVMQDEVMRERNYNEPFSQISPADPGSDDTDWLYYPLY